MASIEKRARIHPFVVMLGDERNLMTRLVIAAHQIGIEERLRLVPD